VKDAFRSKFGTSSLSVQSFFRLLGSKVRMSSKMSLHPIVHIFICLAFSCLVFVLARPLQLLFIFAFSYFYAGLRLERGFIQTLKTLLHSLPLVLSIAILQLIFRRGDELLWSWGVLSISVEGAKLAVQMGLGLLVVIYCAKALAVLSFQEFQLAFGLLRFPEEFAFMLSYAVHLVPAFIKQMKDFVINLKLRGINPSRLPWKQRMQVYKLLAITALADIIKGSSRSAIALELRGFRSNGKRSHLHTRPIKAADILVLLAAGCLLAFFAFGL